ncbi:MAG TPA: hypothetical protein VN428_18605 [Bryobacteraceae bacterium]|nr:hypothetical protein [Bryobacteraceae bacterium]
MGIAASIYDRVFGCPHRRLTRPITPVSKPGTPSQGTYVVCLDCGRQFTYDWSAMRMGEPIASSSGESVLPETPKPANAKIKYALLGSAIPLGFLLGRTLLGRGLPARKPGPPKGKVD